MKLIKRDAKHNYYLLSERDQDHAMYYDSDIIAIDKVELDYRKPSDILNDGDVYACDYSNKIVGDRRLVLDKNSIKIAE